VTRTHLARWSRILPLFAALLLASCASSPDLDELAEVPSAEDLYAEGSAMLEDRGSFLTMDTTDYGSAIERFQDIIDNYPYSAQAVMAELRIADAYFEQERWDEALSYYGDFAELHPDHDKVAYALQRTALCHYKQSGEPERDQRPTREALAALDEVMTRYPYSPEAAEAEVLWKELRTRLGHHVMGIADFYLEQEEYQSAANRYRTVLNDFPGLGLDADALYKLGVCYTHMNRDDEAQHIFEVILENFQGSDVAEAAQELIPAAN